MNVMAQLTLPSSNYTRDSELTAGKAKNEIAKTEKHDAIIFPIHVLGTVSPYPIVVTVI